MYVRMCLGMPIPYKCIQVCLQAHGWSYMHIVIHTVALIVCTIFDLTSICVCVCMIMFVWFCIYESWANANLSPLFAFSQGSFFFQNERFGWFGCDSVPWQVFRGSLATLSPKWKLQWKRLCACLVNLSCGPRLCEKFHRCCFSLKWFGVYHCVCIGVYVWSCRPTVLKVVPPTTSK